MLLASLNRYLHIDGQDHHTTILKWRNRNQCHFSRQRHKLDPKTWSSLVRHREGLGASKGLRCSQSHCVATPQPWPNLFSLLRLLRLLLRLSFCRAAPAEHSSINPRITTARYRFPPPLFSRPDLIQPLSPPSFALTPFSI